MWLTDGGAYNNFGTDWQRLRERLYFDAALSPEEVRAIDKETSGNESRKKANKHFLNHNNKYGQVQIVIDAFQNEPPRIMTTFHIPVFAMLSYVIRTVNVMYGSTLHARREGSEKRATQRMTQNMDKWYPGNQIRKPKEESTNYTSVDLDWHNYGPLIVFVPLSQEPIKSLEDWELHSFIYSPDDKNRQQYEMELEQAEKTFGDLWPTQELVSTTFNSLGDKITLQLVVKGYIMTRLILTAAFGPYRPIPLPNKSWFEDLIPS